MKVISDNCVFGDGDVAENENKTRGYILYIFEMKSAHK